MATNTPPPALVQARLSPPSGLPTDPRQLTRLPRPPQAHAQALAKLHTALSAAAFLSAFVLGVALHYHRIVKNQWYGYPQEWAPSVSATIGDWFPERNVFQLLIALTSGPRFLLILVGFVSHRHLYPHSALPAALAVIAAVRTICCGGWVFVTSSDHGDVHDVFMVAYIVLNLPYMILETVLTPSGTRAKTLRRILGTAFFATLGPLVYFYLEHKQKRVPGAYSIYALFEWSLILLDVSFDALLILDYSPSSSSSASLPALEIAVQSASAEARAHGVYLAPVVGEGARKPPGRVTQALARVEMATARTRHFVADVYLAFVFWTLLVALGPMIFYESVWSMGLSGNEVLLFAILSPILLALPTLRRAFARPALAHLGLLVGLATRWLDGAGIARLRGTALGLGLAVCGTVGGWWEVRREADKVDARARVFLLGLVVSLVVKFANFSLNPLWPFMRASSSPRYDTGGWNGVGLALAVVAYVDAVARRRATVVPPVAAPAGPVESSSSAAAASSSPSSTPSTSLAPSFVAKSGAVVGFGSLFFLLHWLFTDSGTIIAWSWAGYPSSGPYAFPHGLITIVAVLAGVALVPSPTATTRSSLPSFAAACTCATLLLTQTSWASFLPACLLGTYLAALFPSFLLSLTSHTSCGPGAPFAGAFLVYALLELASTWTVAYAFVPAGWVLRERTGTVLALAMAGVAAGLGPAARVRRMAVGAGASAAAGGPGRRGTARTLRTATLVLALTGVAVLVYRAPGYYAPGVPYHAQERLVTAGIWTLHFGLDGAMWESGRRTANMLRTAEVDVIGLLETDVHRMVGGNRDITQFISHSLNMPYVDLGPGPQKNTWGAALISKFPILRSSHHLLPSPNGELAPAIFATLDMYGVEVDVVVAHNGQEEDPLDRELQSAELARLLRESWPRPALFLGYLVTHPHAEKPAPYRYLVEDGRMLDINADDHDRWCQYLFYRGLHRTGYARLNRGSNPSVTDSEVQLGKYVVPLAHPPPGGSPFTASARALLATNASALVPPIPTSAYVAHLHDSPPPRDADSTAWTPERYLPEALRFPARLYGHDEEHRFIVLTGEKGGPGAQYFMGRDEKEWRRLREIEEIEALKAGEGCPVQ
ncbi:hypothetical protein JCM8208_005089 [Rhodotorula glutinis]